jgi:methylmalonyl-CoA/ethylmalonyl-CoA epimerase
MSFVKRVERVALAVENLDEARAFFEKTFDAKFAPLEVIEDMSMRYQPFMIGESRMELLEALDENSPVANFLKRNGGPGVHHITYEVDDLDSAIAELESRGAEIAYRHVYDPEVTFEGYYWQEAFLHPKDTFGVLIHLAQKTPVK